MTEQIDSRAIGALKCIDRATGYILTRPLNVISESADFIRNRSNLYVIKKVAGLGEYTDSFNPVPSLPATGSLSVTVQVKDPLNQYLPRTVDINLPLDTSPENIENSNSIFRPIEVSLYAAPNAGLLSNWSTVRVSVLRNDNVLGEVPVKGSLLRIIRQSDNAVLSSGLSDGRGEALVIIPGVPITQFSEEESSDTELGNDTPVVVSELSVRLEVSFDSSVSWPVNPDVLEANHSSNLVATENMALRTGRMEKINIVLN
ncbi:hypothetical protein MNBD_GAMMA09-516 [hydrothermal vent metagenome]|uniref:Uncharacterized protein n=1 Tax=hydrothermal vent metagenome TaxID=652676 RepID=A0A3B0XN01_9ZZZZ